MNHNHNTLEKRCISKTFPQIVPEEDRCPKHSCDGYDKFCPKYIATASFNVDAIRETLVVLDGHYKGGKNATDTGYHQPSD